MTRRQLISAALVMLLLVSISGMAVPQEDKPTFGSAMGRACGGPVDTSSITVLPPGPVTLPADQSLLFNATLYNSDGTELGGNATWGTDDGSIQPQGGGGAIYYPSSIGTHFVWACAAEVNASVEVEVTIGATQSLTLIGSAENVTPDDEIDFQVMRHDVHGNAAPLYVPSQYWTIPAGSTIVSASGQPARWSPGPLGNFLIEVSSGGFTAQFEVNVSRGVGQDLVVTYSQSQITSDDSVSLSMMVSDSAGNSWAVDGEWSTLQPEAAEWLSSNGSVATFDGHTIGNWTVRADYNGLENGFINMSDEVTIDVRIGRISLVIIDGHDSTILTGETLELNPVATDLDGNVVEGATFNWSVDGISGVDSIDGEAATFTPSGKGQHTIFVESGGRPSSARVQVEWSEPVALNVTTTGGDWYLTVTTGQSLPLHVLGLDVMGVWHPYDPVWVVEDAWGSVEEAGGDGDYLYNAAGVNWTQLHAFVGEEEYTVLVYVTQGQLDHLTVQIQDYGIQGEFSTFIVEGFDVSGNGVSIPICDIVIDSSAGKAECLDDQWTLSLDNDGEQQLLTATYDGSEGSAFIDVRPTLLDGEFGSSTQVIVGGAGFLGLLITLVLVFSYARVRRLAKEIEAEELAEEEEELRREAAEKIANAVAAAPAQPAFSAQGGAQMQVKPPPPSPAIMGKMNRRRKKPATPPPAFMFGQGVVQNTTGAAPQAGIFVRSDPQYGWGDPEKAPPEGYGWEGQTAPQSSAVIGGTPIPPGAPAPPTGFGPEPQSPAQAAPTQSEPASSASKLSDALSRFGDPSDGDEEPEPETEVSPLTNALSKLGASDVEGVVEAEPQVEVEEPETEVEESEDESVMSEEPEVEAEVEAEEEPYVEPQVEAEVEELADLEEPAESEESVESEESAESEEPAKSDQSETAPQEFEEEVVWDDPEPDLEPESEADDDWGTGWDSDLADPSSVAPGLGPLFGDGAVLKPLPGTKPGESGWYFDSDGKPSLWEFRPFGWERIE